MKEQQNYEDNTIDDQNNNNVFEENDHDNVQENLNDSDKPKYNFQNKNKIIIIVILIAIMLLMLYFFMSSDDDNDKKKLSDYNTDKSSSLKQNYTTDDSSLNNTQYSPIQNKNFTINDVQKTVSQPEIPLPPPPAPTDPGNPVTLEIPKPQPKLEKKSSSKNTTIPALNNDFNSSQEIKPINNIPLITESKEEKQKKLATMSSSIMVFGGATGGDIENGSVTDGKNKDAKNTQANTSVDASKKFLGFDGGNIDNNFDVLNESSGAITVTQVKNLQRTIVQGKIIDAVLETAITTQMGQSGIVRATISRDVYADQGKNILIPKGSRVIGNYQGGVKDGQTRVSIVWDRIVTPKGIDIKIASEASDRLGRTGVPGFVDDKFGSKLISALLISYIIPLGALEITGGGNDTITTSNDGTKTSNTTTARAQILSDATDEFSTSAEDIVKQRFPDTTVISVDQGAMIKILANKDIVFPNAAIDHSNVNYNN
ncbi:TrbI/VirB10 family protein [Lyticum sinuosum]|uniref:Type IV secretion system protein virB10 n=1 Tax=Lyticum sinuosum TaxID=1332059 RepID=A0AAE4VJ41_9RICK|nr:TrbI/VirB10 family protein [Lyticum sinuosum]MDZ5760960.1 Type IV secretion system protein virB10 [Lyticum sinuosum]